MYLYRLKTKFKVKLKRKLSKLGKFTCSIDENLQLKKNKLNNCSIEIETFIKIRYTSIFKTYMTVNRFIRMVLFHIHYVHSVLKKILIAHIKTNFKIQNVFFFQFINVKCSLCKAKTTF